jgi:hypothetical protein
VFSLRYESVYLLGIPVAVTSCQSLFCWRSLLLRSVCYKRASKVWHPRTKNLKWDFRFSRRRVWRWLFSALLRRVVWYKFTDVLADSVIRAMTEELMMEAGSTSETSINFCQTTTRNNPEDSHLHKSLEAIKERTSQNCYAMRTFPNFLHFTFLGHRCYSRTLSIKAG